METCYCDTDTGRVHAWAYGGDPLRVCKRPLSLYVLSVVSVPGHNLYLACEHGATVGQDRYVCGLRAIATREGRVLGLWNGTEVRREASTDLGTLKDIMRMTIRASAWPEVAIEHIEAVFSDAIEVLEFVRVWARGIERARDTGLVA